MRCGAGGIAPDAACRRKVTGCKTGFAPNVGRDRGLAKKPSPYGFEGLLRFSPSICLLLKASIQTARLPSPPEEQAAWRDIVGTWQPLHGSIFGGGLSVEWHDFRLNHDIDWSRSFHRHSLELCLNFSGAAVLNDGNGEQSLGPNQVAIYTTHGKRMEATRRAGTLHRFLTVELSPDFLRTHFASMLDRLKPPVRCFIENAATGTTYLEVLMMPASLLSTRVQFVAPPAPPAGRDIWYLGRVLEILAQTLFPAEQPEELFCHRHQRANRERVDRACFLISRDLENPPSLEMLATEVGCSTFYLSRIFTEQTGVSIPKFLRMKRIEKAAEYIRGGKMNVTEAAFAVGYSSLSAFNKAFVEQIGCCPGLYPNVPIPGRKKRVVGD